MTKKQKIFCDEYLVDLNATQAAIRAGYSAKTAYSIGSELLKEPEIRARVDKALAERSKRTGINADRVLAELAKVAFMDATDVIDTQTGGVRENAKSEDTACIAGIKTKVTSGDGFDSVEREIRLCDKVKALELLGKHLGMFQDNIKIDGEAKVTIVDDLG